MTEIVAAAISAIVALGVAYLAHRRASKASILESQHKEDEIGNDRIKVITSAYEGLLVQLRDEIQRLAEARMSERDRWEAKERVLLSRIANLEAELQKEKNERERMQSRLDRLERQIKFD